jgi:hypothetical protein
MAEPIDPARGFDIDRWIEERRAELSMPALYAAIFWPPQPGRGRVHLCLFGHDAELRAFAKIAFDDADKEGVYAEQKALLEMAEQNTVQSSSPKLMSAGSFGACEYLVAEPIPRGIVPFPANASAFPLEVVRELSGTQRSVAPCDFPSLTWWEDFESYFDKHAPNFYKVLNDGMADGVVVCRIHGDLCAENIGRCGDKLWIYDWERSRADGPVFYDEITFCFGCVRGRIYKNGSTVLRDLLAHFMADEIPEHRFGVMLSLGMMASERSAVPCEIVRLWDEHLGSSAPAG